MLKCLRFICFLQTSSFSLHKMLIYGLESCELLVDFCDVFMFKSVLMKKQTHPHLRWPESEYIWVNYYFTHH